MQVIENKIEKLIEEAEKAYYDTIPCKGLKEKKGFSCRFDNRPKAKGKEYFIATHRARSKGYNSFDKIPQSVIDFIDSTG